MNTEIILIASIFLLLIIAILPLFIHRTITATISGFSWTRKIFFEHCLWVEETSHSGFPDGSINQESHMETYYSYEVVSYNTQTTQINGVTSTTTQPVYGNVPSAFPNEGLGHAMDGYLHEFRSLMPKKVT